VRVDLDAWGLLSPAAQEAAIGRHRESGAALGRSHEFETLPLENLPPASHVRLASAKSNGGATVLRKGYSHRASAEEGERDDDGLPPGSAPGDSWRKLWPEAGAASTLDRPPWTDPAKIDR
jgi:deferrochelatase/peroxidase EfeB